MMRPNQQKNRSRGRNNGRKHANPLSRNYESNGPDVKVRGNAAHIAEKYTQLARDAQASGDSVMAENYLQHAEHYYRILLAAQPQMVVRQDQNGAEDGDEDGQDDTGGDGEEAQAAPAQPERAEFREGREGRDNRRPRRDRQERQDRQEQPSDDEGQSAEEAVSAASADEAQPEDATPRARRPRRPRRSAEPGADPASAPQPEMGELPAFLTGGAPAK